MIQSFDLIISHVLAVFNTPLQSFNSFIYVLRVLSVFHFRLSSWGLYHGRQPDVNAKKFFFTIHISNGLDNILLVSLECKQLKILS